MKPVRVEVLAHTFEGMGVCPACELVLSEAGVGELPALRGLDEVPREWQEDYQRLTEWVYGLADRYGDRIEIRVIDPQSPEGLVKSLRYRVRHYPTWIVNGKERVVGWDHHALASALKQIVDQQGEG